MGVVGVLLLAGAGPQQVLALLLIVAVRAAALEPVLLQALAVLVAAVGLVKITPLAASGLLATFPARPAVLVALEAAGRSILIPALALVRQMAALVVLAATLTRAHQAALEAPLAAALVVRVRIAAVVAVVVVVPQQARQAALAALAALVPSNQ